MQTLIWFVSALPAPQLGRYSPAAGKLLLVTAVYILSYIQHIMHVHEVVLRSTQTFMMRKQFPHTNSQQLKHWQINAMNPHSPVQLALGFSTEWMEQSGNTVSVNSTHVELQHRTPVGSLTQLSAWARLIWLPNNLTKREWSDYFLWGRTTVKRISYICSSHSIHEVYPDEGFCFCFFFVI